MSRTPRVRALAAHEWQTYRDLRLRALADSPDAFGRTFDEARALPDAEWRARLAEGAASEASLPLVAETDEPIGLAWGRILPEDPETAHLFLRAGTAPSRLARARATDASRGPRRAQPPSGTATRLDSASAPDTARGMQMASWSEFADAAPEISRLGVERLFQFGPGLAFLATVRADGGPRVHPVCVNLVEDDLYLLIGVSPKRRDLLRDGRFALHSFPAPEADDEFYLTGVAEAVCDEDTIRKVAAAQVARGATTSGDEVAFRLQIERALYSRYKPRGEPDNWPPEYLKWSAGSEAARDGRQRG